MRHCLILLVALSASSAYALESAVTARYTETQLDFLVPPKHIESRCGSAMFGIEWRAYSGNGPAWVCIARDWATDRMVVMDWGYSTLFSYNRIIREPTATDRNFILANDNNFIAFDPVTLQQTVVGTLNPPAVSVNSGTIFQLMPENVPEVLLNTANGWEVRTYPGGQILLAHVFGTRRVGHFLSPQTTQLLDLGNDQFDLYDAHNGQFVKSVQAPQTYTVFGIADWTGNGKDSVYYENATQALLSKDLATAGTVSAGGVADFVLLNATPVNWSGTKRALAGLWAYAVRVFDPITGTPLYAETLPVSPSQAIGPTAFWATEYETVGKQDLLWTTWGGNLLYLPNGGATSFVQTASGGYVAAGTTGPGFDLLVTADTYVSTDAYALSHLDLVFRDPDTLVELFRRSDPAPQDSQVFVGAFGPTSDLVAITADEGRIAAERATDGQPLWEINNDKYTSGNGWYAFAVPPPACTGARCKRMLIASIAFDSATKGSFVQVIDTTDGSTIWSSTPDNCLGCGSSVIAFADVNGDGVPDVVRMKPFDVQNPGLLNNAVQVLDGLTFQALWTTNNFASSVWAVAVATVGAPNVAALMPANVTLLASSDGLPIASSPIQTQPYLVTPLYFAPFSANEGAWVLSADPTAVTWLPADLSRPAQTMLVPGVRSFAGGPGGIVFAAGREGIFRLQLTPDHVFADAFEQP